MKFLKALATPFVKLWRWIKETAWVQPLLIVGLIFGVIFSIPSITSWVSSWDFGDDTYTWLEGQKLSLKGVTDTATEGDAYTFFEKFNEAEAAWQTGDKAKAKSTLESYTGNQNKMFLYFYKEDTTCADINDASNYLEHEGWQAKVSEKASTIYGNDAGKYNQAFKYKTIHVEEKIDVEADDHTYDDFSAFEYLLVSKAYNSYFNTIWDVAQTCNYYKNLDTSSAKTTFTNNIDNIIKKDSYLSSTPYIVLIDMSEANTSTHIVTNVFFSVDGSTKYTKADFLAHAWLSSVEFEAKTK